jgi:hypothetical protein
VARAVLGQVPPSDRLPLVLAGTGLRHLLVPVDSARGPVSRAALGKDRAPRRRSAPQQETGRVAATAQPPRGRWRPPHADPFAVPPPSAAPDPTPLTSGCAAL